MKDSGGFARGGGGGGTMRFEAKRKGQENVHIVDVDKSDE